MSILSSATCSLSRRSIVPRGDRDDPRTISAHGPAARQAFRREHPPTERFRSRHLGRPQCWRAQRAQSLRRDDPGIVPGFGLLALADSQSAVVRVLSKCDPGHLSCGHVDDSAPFGACDAQVVAQLSHMPICGRPGGRLFRSGVARSRVLTSVRPLLRPSYVAGPYGSSRIRSKSQRRTWKHLACTGFPDPVSSTVAPYLPFDLPTSSTTSGRAD